MFLERYGGAGIILCTFKMKNILKFQSADPSQMESNTNKYETLLITATAHQQYDRLWVKTEKFSALSIIIPLSY